MSTATLKELLEQKEQLERMIEEQRKNERKKGFDEIRDAMARHGLTMADVVKELGTSKGKQALPTQGKRVAVKYLDPATGNQWTGRGLRPKWLRDKIDSGSAKLEDFLVK
jgi:DNA-binding protein H-NS